MIRASFVLLGVLLFTLHDVAYANETNPRPNVVLFLVDDMGIMDTSVPFLTDESGEPQLHPLNRYYRTPHMERLAKQGIRFSQFNAMSVCSPTRITLMTGQTSARHHTTNWINSVTNNTTPSGPPEWNWLGLNHQNITLPRLLQQSGYHTIHIGKAHFGPNAAADPTEIGFDINIAGGPMGRPGSYFSVHHYGNLLKDNKGNRIPTAVPHLEKYHDSGLFLTEALTREAIAQVDQAGQETKPFFLHFAHYAVHSPFQADPRFIENYPDDPAHKDHAKFGTLIEGMDRSLGDLLDALEKNGQAERTLIVFMGDNGSDAPLGDEHGYSSAAPLRGKKGTHYEGGMRVPLIVAWAKPQPDSPLQQKFPIAANRIQTQFANACDIMPTLLEIGGVSLPHQHVIDGTSLVPLLTGKPDPEHSDKFLMHFPHAHRSNYFTTFRDRDWKVIYHYLPEESAQPTHYQLFNLKADPWERDDLAASHPEELRRMMQSLRDELKRCGAQYPVDATSGQILQPIVP